MLKLIVNADDLGLCESVNEGIVQAHQSGIVTSASIMANGRAFDHAIRLCQLVPSLDLGIHLTLVEEKPLREASTIPSLVGAGGKLHPHATTFMKKYVSGAIRVREVWSELEAQIQKVVSRGISVSHLDSHQHLHALPHIRRVSIELAKKYNIPAIGSLPSVCARICSRRRNRLQGCRSYWRLTPSHGSARTCLSSGRIISSGFSLAAICTRRICKHCCIIYRR